jgi:hypothetical protein
MADALKWVIKSILFEIEKNRSGKTNYFLRVVNYLFIPVIWIGMLCGSFVGISCLFLGVYSISGVHGIINPKEWELWQSIFTLFIGLIGVYFIFIWTRSFIYHVKVRNIFIEELLIFIGTFCSFILWGIASLYKGW